jgi:hypothetical protein
MSENQPPSTDAISPFYLKRVFPEAQAIFDCKRTTLEEGKESSFVALDANVLLLPYKLDGISLPDVINVYTALSKAGRLVIPAQAAREFAKHRASKVGDLVKYLRDEASLSGPKLSKKVGALVGHPGYEAAKKLADEIAKQTKTLKASILSVADDFAANVGEDPVSVAYRGIFSGVVCEEPAECEDEAAFSKALSARYSERRPPGYKDKTKPDAGAGDLLIWKTILEEGKKRKLDCIFVTADEKADWYAQSQGAFQPRFELVEEYRVYTGNTLHIVPLSGLLQVMQADQMLVEQVQRAESIMQLYPVDWAILSDAVRSQRKNSWFEMRKSQFREDVLQEKLRDVVDRLAKIEFDLEQYRRDPSLYTAEEVENIFLDKHDLRMSKSVIEVQIQATRETGSDV